ncbi:MAG: divalent-cation tolerance protein CutA [Acidobacteria bacterium]|nr:divalent-cation tolerance protein CutA [Acidobacteriota bacterium]
MTDVVVVLTTVPDDARGEALARQLVAERLAACASLYPPMISFYRWKGQIAREPERQLVVKTTQASLPALKTRLAQLHPYELPELLALPAEAGAEYLAWVNEETGGL